MKLAHDNLIAASGAGNPLESQSQNHNADHHSDWQQELASAIRDPRELLEELCLDPALLADAEHAAALFPLMLPRGMLRRIRPGDPDDPVLRQFLPISAEFGAEPAHYRQDPLAESEQMAHQGLIQKYQGRALITLGSSCAVNCRYCFRRSFPYSENRIGADAWKQIHDWFLAHPEVSEAILSGGDPLVISDQRLARLGSQLAAIPGIRRLRIHTRLPTVLPTRVTPELLGWIESLQVPLVIVLHCNHAQEIDQEVGEALKRLSDAGAILLNQSVLLAGVNDNAEVLRDLSETLFEYRVLPYYLHLLDPVSGSSQFEVAEQRGIDIMRQVRGTLPGYLVPLLVREVPGDANKRPIA